MSSTIDIRRNGDEWIIDDGSAQIRITKPGAGIVDRFIHQWQERADRQKTPNVAGAKRKQARRQR